MTTSISKLKRVRDETKIKNLIEQEYDRTGGIFRLIPCWVGRPGIIIPGRRIKLKDDYINQDVVVNERWLASVTYADNGIYNSICPNDHGLSYLIVGDSKVQLKEAIEVCGTILLGKERKWDVLSKFFDNWHRIPHHLHPCDDHCSERLRGKPESYYFPEELNMNKNAFPHTSVGVDPVFTDDHIMNYLLQYFKGDNRLTELSNTIDLIPGTGWFMPPCTLHAPGSLVTYELQVASDVTCIPESRVNDMVMPPDLIDRDIPVKIAVDGLERVCQYIVDMIRCKNSGNFNHFQKEYFRPPVKVFELEEGSQSFIIYRTGKSSERVNPDFYSAKKMIVNHESILEIEESEAFGAIILGGHGEISVPGKAPVAIESVSMYPTRNDLGGDEIFVAKDAAAKLIVRCNSIERLSIYQHFASNSNPEGTSLEIPEYFRFE